MVEKLMTFNPDRRLTVEQALLHPYMAPFTTGNEPKCPGILTVPIDDDHKARARRPVRPRLASP